MSEYAWGRQTKAENIPKKYRKNQYENMSEKDAQKKITSKNTKNPIQKYVKENQRKQ